MVVSIGTVNSGLESFACCEDIFCQAICESLEGMGDRVELAALYVIHTLSQCRKKAVKRGTACFYRPTRNC